MSEQTTQLVVMLTHNDRTVDNAIEIFEQCKDAKAQFWGFKEDGIPKEQMKQLISNMKARGKTTFLEIVVYTEAACIQAAHNAAECGCDILMGTKYFDTVHEICKKHNMKYMPFIGQVTDRPSILSGSLEDMLREAEACIKKGVDGFDLLAYRYNGDAPTLIEQFVANVNVPVCIAGGIDSYQKLDVIKSSNAWSFTIGGAFFDQKFEGTFSDQINKVYDYIMEGKLDAKGILSK